MPVDVEHHPVAVELGALVVRQPPQPGQVVALVEGHAVLAGQPLAGVDLRFQLPLEPGVHARERTSRVRGALRGPRSHEMFPAFSASCYCLPMDGDVTLRYDE